ncbi:MAG TPA: polysaccharide biosynthesis tyrosine autokinase, partial [Longimicrobiales bacterium]
RQGMKTGEALSTVRFLKSQIDTLSGQLTAAEDALRDFRERNQLVAPEEEAKAQVTRLVEMQAQRDVADAERSALAGLLAQAQAAPGSATAAAPMRRLIAFPTLLKNPAASEMLRSLNEAEDKRAELLDRRKPEDPDVQVLTARINDLDTQLGTIVTTYLHGLENQIGSYDGILHRFGAVLDRIPATEVQYARLLRQEKVLSEIYTMLQTRLKEAQIMAAVEDPSVRVVDPAIPPDKPVRPNIPLSLGLAAFLGIILGVGLAFGREHLDGSVRTREDLLAVGGQLPVLGTIPRIHLAPAVNGDRFRRVFRRNGVLASASQERLIAMRDPRSPISEAYRSLRTNITFARPERPPKTLVFTSPGPGEGKSTSTANLAATLAQQGLRCLLVDADMRRGALHVALRARREPGLSDLIVGRAEWTAGVQRVELDEGVGFDFLGGGTPPPNPAELLGSAGMAALLARAAPLYDAILLDAPPLNLVTDAAVLGTKVDGVIVVARAGVTDRAALEYAFQQLQAVHAPVLGSILNDLDQKRGRYYGAYGPGGYVANNVEAMAN